MGLIYFLLSFMTDIFCSFWDCYEWTFFLRSSLIGYYGTEKLLLFFLFKSSVDCFTDPSSGSFFCSSRLSLHLIKFFCHIILKYGSFCPFLSNVFLSFPYRASLTRTNVNSSLLYIVNSNWDSRYPSLLPAFVNMHLMFH